MVNHPDKENSKALYAHDTTGDLSASVVYNFPMMKSGIVKFRIKPSAETITTSLTDNFSVVNDMLADDNAIFTLDIKLQVNQWNDVEINYNQNSAKILINGKKSNKINLKREMIWGVNYIRLSCPEKSGSSGFYVDYMSFSGDE